jgi:hypothetical protein
MFLFSTPKPSPRLVSLTLSHSIVFSPPLGRPLHFLWPRFFQAKAISPAFLKFIPVGYFTRYLNRKAHLNLVFTSFINLWGRHLLRGDKKKKKEKK